MARRRRTGGLFLGLAALYVLVFAGRYAYLKWTRQVRLEAVKDAFFRYELVDIRLRTHDGALKARWRQDPPVVRVLRGGAPVTTIAGLREVVLRPDGAGDWVGRWPCPWNAPVGRYDLELSSGAVAPERLRARPFRVAARKPSPLPPGFAAVTLESDQPLARLKVPAPDGTVKDWRGLLDWVEYVGADAFWVLGGRTPGAKPGEVWLDANFALFPELGRECRRRGLKLGLYAMSYLTMSDVNKVPQYEYARDVADGRSYETRAVSLREPRRVADVAALLKRFRDIPEVDYVGLDYIRNALGGVELVDEFFAEMPGVRPPPGWERLKPEERMVWLARKKNMRKDAAFIDAWQWWRAHRVGRIVRRVKDELGDAKPLWAFTLTWDKGWHHGQDPVMMNDAGVDADALMLYEADAAQYEALLKDWNRYVKRADVQLLVGDVVDWPLHQRHPDGPLEFRRRTVRAIDGIYGDGPARGVFIHDLGRALWGRKGPWSTRDWMDQAKAAIAHLRATARPEVVSR